MAISPCTFAAADGKSSRVAIDTRGHAGMKHSIKAEAWPEHIKSRFALNHIAAVCKGGIHAGSCYLTSCNAGISGPRNLDALQLMAGVLRAVRGPCVIAGNWNCTPDDLKNIGWLELVGAMIVAPNTPTRGAMIIDFFVIAESIGHVALK